MRSGAGCWGKDRENPGSGLRTGLDWPLRNGANMPLVLRLRILRGLLLPQTITVTESLKCWCLAPC